MDSIPRLETDRLKLRAIFPEDAEAIFKLFSDSQVTRYYDFEPYVDVQQARDLINQFTRWFQKDLSVRWGIIDKPSDRLIGTCCFDSFKARNQSVNLGYDIQSKHWGRGFATEAAGAVIALAFRQGIVGRVNRIEAKTIPENVGSEKVLLKLGFQKEGLMRQYGCWNDQFHDMNLFSLTRDQVAGSTT